ncbi:hypothetical protein [Tropicimonas sp. IMCC6043]|uniref:hypothetical protein n=1 Tax=Tropicimonas sp. IMCC6043 TaxID=2510645 RepID=UPI00101E039D|nr:hypothetical protein [Tropicimonas sp. IMCC6043]RYH09589.1 hypothetical protein EU800_11605 [Tropicimonas sp. IMCC6043]
MKHADVATKLVQFFVLASVAVGGWVVASEDLRAMPAFSSPRLVWAILYTLMAAPIWLALLDLQRRINACYALARQTMPVVADDLARDFDVRLVAFGFPLFVVTIDLIILLAP